MRNVRIQKIYKDEDAWFGIKEDEALIFLSQVFVDPQATLDGLKVDARENAPEPSRIVVTPWALYRVVA